MANHPSETAEVDDHQTILHDAEKQKENESHSAQSSRAGNSGERVVT